MRPRPALVAPLALVVALAAACSTSDPEASSTSTSRPSSTTTTTAAPLETGSTELTVGGRTARLVAPAEVTAPSPLVVLLHGFSTTAEFLDTHFGVTEQAASRGLYVLLASGSTDADGNPFWDATPACCNPTGTPVDDVGHVSDLIDEAIAVRPIDPDRVYLLGLSNGGFMSYRMACDAADHVTAIAVVAGSELPSVDDCTPSRPVSVLHLHGTADDIVPFAGGRIPAFVGDFPGDFPGAVEVVARWATRARCDAAPAQTEPLDLDAGIAGAETAVTAYRGCADGTAVQLDAIEGGGHLPAIPAATVGTEVLDWLLSRSR